MKEKVMEILDYVEWRGDLSFSASPFNPVDAMILCEIAYYKYDSCVPADFDEEPVKLKDVFEQNLLDPLPNYCSEKDLQLQQMLKTTVRYGEILLCGFRNIVDEERNIQFSAITCRLDDKTTFVAFRGTDDSLIGWKENMDLAYNDEVPAQKEAVLYLKEVAQAVRGRLIVGGHSKGGNLAVYGGAFVPKKVSRRIRKIYNFDGPGFNEKVIANERFLDIVPRTWTYVPQDSLVGLLLEHKEPVIVIHSDESNGMKQHRLHSWQVTPFDIVRESGLTKRGENSRENISEWIASMSEEEKRELIKTVYDLVDEYKTTGELASAKTIWKIIKEYRSLSDGDKKNITDAMWGLKDTIIGNWIERFEDMKIMDRMPDFLKRMLMD